MEFGSTGELNSNNRNGDCLSWWSWIFAVQLFFRAELGLSCLILIRFIFSHNFFQ
jgi:hypothetical protein